MHKMLSGAGAKLYRRVGGTDADPIWEEVTCATPRPLPPVTPDGTALFATILAHPNEDTPRLVYADWLQENDQPERAEIIRVQCEKSRLEQLHTDAPNSHDLCCRRKRRGRCRAFAKDGDCLRCIALRELAARDKKIKRLRQREQELLDLNWYEWIDPKLQGWISRSDFRRGFPERFDGPCKVWRERAEAILRDYPVTKVVWTDFTDNDRSRILVSAAAKGIDIDGRMYADIAAEIWKGVTFDLTYDIYQRFNNMARDAILNGVLDLFALRSDLIGSITAPRDFITKTPIRKPGESE